MKSKLQIERERLEDARLADEDAQFLSELSEYVATLPEPSADSQKRYAEMIVIFDEVHAEIEAARKPVKQVGDDWNPTELMDSKYLEPYNVSSR